MVATAASAEPNLEDPTALLALLEAEGHNDAELAAVKAYFRAGNENESIDLNGAAVPAVAAPAPAPQPETPAADPNDPLTQALAAAQPAVVPAPVLEVPTVPPGIETPAAPAIPQAAAPAVPSIPAAPAAQPAAEPSPVLKARDGVNEIPFEVLQNTRDANQRLADENRTLKEQLAAQPAAPAVPAAPAAPQPHVQPQIPTVSPQVTAAIAKMRTEFGDDMAGMFQLLAENSAQPATAVVDNTLQQRLDALERQQQQSIESQRTDQRTGIQAAIDANPAVAAWQAEAQAAAADPTGGKSASMFNQFVALDSALADDLAWAGRSLQERFTHVASLLNRDGSAGGTPADPSQVPGGPPAAVPAVPAAAPAAVVPPAPAPVPTSLSDLPAGTAPVAKSVDDVITGMSHAEMHSLYTSGQHGDAIPHIMRLVDQI